MKSEWKIAWPRSQESQKEKVFSTTVVFFHHGLFCYTQRLLAPPAHAQHIEAATFDDDLNLKISALSLYRSRRATGFEELRISLFAVLLAPLDVMKLRERALDGALSSRRGMKRLSFFNGSRT